MHKAAEGGCAEAQYQLGKINYVRDVAEAAMWYQKAAEQGHPDALESLGQMYRYGTGGLEKDVNKAVALLQEAADKGCISAYNLLGLMYNTGARMCRKMS